MKTIKVLFSLCLFINNITLTSQTVYDTTSYNNGIWLFSVSGMNSSQLSNLAASNPNIKGAGVFMNWKDIEPITAGHFVWNNFDSQIQNIAAQGWFINLMIWAGPSAPFWIYTSPHNVDSVITNDPLNGFYLNRYPYYLHPMYKTLWYRMIDSVSNHIDHLPASIRKKIIIYQSAEGTTGDLDWYKGDPITVPSGTSTCNCTNYSITPTQWGDFTRAAWKYTYAKYSVKIPAIHLLLNTGAVEGSTYLGAPANNFLWANDSLPYVWRKATNVGHMYQLNNEVDFKNIYDPLVNIPQPLNSSTTQIRIRDEFDFHQNTSNFLLNYAAWNSYWLALSSLHFGLDMWNIFNYEFPEPRFIPAFNFFSKYAGYKNAGYAPGAFCALRDGLDANDIVRFPVSTYGNGTILNTTAGKNRCIAIANSYSLYAAKQQDPPAAQGNSLNQINNVSALNDVGWNIISGNYERYLTQWKPNTTSQGYWRQGDTTQPYGRFARGFNHSANKDTMFFNINDNFFATFPNNSVTTVTINVTYLDKGTSKWKLMYDGKNGTTGLSQIMTAYTNTNTNTTNAVIQAAGSHQNEKYLWKTKSMVISNGMFGNNLPHSTDIMLVNADNTDDIFHMIEVLRGTSLLTSAFNINTTTCIGQQVSLNDGSVGGATSWHWTMPGGAPSSSTLQNTSTTYTAAGVYSITLVVNGISTPFTRTISVLPTPTITVSGGNAVCSGNTVVLTASGATSYTWMPGNIHTNTLSANPTSTAVYTVTGYNNNCSSVKTKAITVNPLPNLAITLASSLVCAGQSAIMLATGATSYTWLPINSHAFTVTVTPATTSNYTLTGSSGSCTNSAVKTISVVSTLTLGITGNNFVCSGNGITLSAFGASNYLWMPGGSTSAILNTIPFSTTVYTLTGSVGSCSAVAAAFKTVSVNPSPSVIISASSTVICQGQVLVLTASGAQTYTFYPGGVTSNPAASSPTITTSYTVTGASSNGCENNSVITVSTTSCLSIEEQKNARPVLVYPNPTVDVLKINLKDKIDESEEFTIILIDDIGREVLRKKYSEIEFILDVKKFSEGVYILKVIGNQREYIQKIVVYGH